MNVDFDAFYSVKDMPGVAWTVRGYAETDREVCEREPTCYGHPCEDAADVFPHAGIGDTFFCEADDDGEFSCGGEEWIYEIVSEVDNSRVIAVMVGDDREHEIDVDDLVEIDEEDFCLVCGQIGCGHG